MAKVDIKLVQNNPFRNMTLYPISNDQVSKLVASFKETGFWGALPARKTQEGYEIAAGHHRLAAAKKMKHTKVELDISEISDEDMQRIMIKENFTQRGATNFGATIEAVAATAKLVATEVLAIPERPKGKSQKAKNEQEVWDEKYGKTMTKKELTAWATTRGQILKGRGIGLPAVSAANPDIPQFSIRQALHVLQTCGLFYDSVLKGVPGLGKDAKAKYKSAPAHVKAAYKAVATFPSPLFGAVFLDTFKALNFKEGVKPTAQAIEKVALKIIAQPLKPIPTGSNNQPIVLSSAMIKEEVKQRFSDLLETDDSEGQDSGEPETEGKVTDRDKQLIIESEIAKAARDLDDAINKLFTHYPETKTIDSIAEWYTPLTENLDKLENREIETEEERTAADEENEAAKVAEPENNGAAQEAGEKQGEEEVDLTA